MREKRGQAALEFLMTYGWAILVVLVVIGALAYFGVLNPNTLVPEKCTLQTGIACKDYVLKNDGALINIENGMGKGIYIMNATLNVTDGQECYSVYYNSSTDSLVINTSINDDIIINASNTKPGLLVPNGGSAIFLISTNSTGTCSIVDMGRKVKAEVTISYYYQDSSETFLHTAEGEILARIES